MAGTRGWRLSLAKSAQFDRPETILTSVLERILYERRPPGGPANRTTLTVAMLMMLVLTVLGPIMTMNGTSMTGEGSPTRQAAYLFAALLVVAGVRPIQDSRRLIAVPWPLVAAVGYCWLTLTWSAEPGIAMRRLILTTVIIWMIFAAVAQMGSVRMLTILRIVVAALLFANFAAVLLVPSVGIHQAADVLDKNLIGDWRGIMQQKNFAGATCALTILLFLYDARSVPLALRALVIAGSAVFLLKTGSRTSLGDCVGAALIGAVYLLYNARYRLILLSTLAVAIVVTGGIISALQFHFSGGEESQNVLLSGRVEIWDMMGRFLHDHADRGAGYGSFWNVGPDSPVYRYAKGWVVDLASGHNGFLDLMAAIGIPGLVVVLAATFVLPLLRLLMSRSANGQRGALVLSMLVFCITHNLTESSLLDRDSVVEVFLMVALALLVAVTPDMSGPWSPFGTGLPEARLMLSSGRAARRS